MNQNENKIKILDFCPFYSPHIGGLEKYAEELYENLSKKDCQVTVFTPHIPTTSPKKETRNGISIIRYPAFEIIYNFPIPCFWKRDFWRQWRIIFRDHFDLAISTSRFFVQPSMALLYAKLKRIPILHIEHGSDFVRSTPVISVIARIFDYTLGWLVLSCANRVVAPSQSAARFIKILSKRNAPVIYRGMPFSDIDAISPQEKIKKQFENKKIIAYVGRLIFGKGIIHLLRAFSALKGDDVVLLIVGDGAEMKNLKEYVQRNNLMEKVVFLGSVPFSEAISILKISDIFVNPSYNEGLPTSVLEAGVCERAIIATNVGGTPEIITHDQSGIIIKSHSSKAVLGALKELLDDPGRRAILGKNARKEIEKRFNWEASINAYLREIESILK